ncbi:MAG: hypothetical protein HXY34_06165 [Candidatus Thorarchaeota archaeon]|nr:hypothetical protein [Candidatus Thorarchaeota archaeon]
MTSSMCKRKYVVGFSIMLFLGASFVISASSITSDTRSIEALMKVPVTIDTLLTQSNGSLWVREQLPRS